MSKKILFVVLISLFLLANSSLNSEDNSMINLSKKIWEMEKLDKEGKSYLIKQYKFDKNKKIRKIADILMNKRYSELHPEERWSQYEKIGREIKDMDFSTKKKYLIDKIVNWDCKLNKLCVMEYEAAMLHIIEIGDEIVPDLLNMAKLYYKRIKDKEPPKYEKEHTMFSLLLKLLISISPKITKSYIEEYKNSQNTFVRKKAEEVLYWINADIKYPFKYERILLKADDEINHSER